LILPELSRDQTGVYKSDEIAMFDKFQHITGHIPALLQQTPN
jgi:hypothetical protein